MTTFLGAVTPPSPSYDVEAFNELVAQAERADTAFDLDAIDRGIDRLVAHPQRATHGKRLTQRLIRDARRHLQSTRRCEFLTDKIDKPNRNFPPPSFTELDDVRRAVTIINNGLSKLGSRDRLVLMAKVTGHTAANLAVKARQQRNLVTAAREQLWLQPGVALACEVVMDALGRWRFETIELLALLWDGMCSLN